MPIPALSRRAFWTILAIAVAVFVFAGRPVWEDPFHIDYQIVWSYLILPPLAALFLLREKKLGWAWWGLESVLLVVCKFGITYIIATGLWIGAGAPPPRAANDAERLHAHESSAVEAESPPPPSLIEERGRVEVRVERAGRGLAGVDVWISAGLRELSFAPTGNVEFVNHGHGFVGERSVVQTWQGIHLLSADGRLHTAWGHRDGQTVFNLPVLASGAPRRIELRRAWGAMQIGCRAHPDEAPLAVVVVGHPFFTRSSADAVAVFDDVPARRVSFTAALSGGTNVSGEIDVRARQEHTLVLELPDT